MTDRTPTRLVRRTHTPRRGLACVALVAAFVVGVACSDQGSQAPVPTPTPTPIPTPTPKETPAAAKTPAAPAAVEPAAESPADLAKRGRSVYMSNCIACHNPDPSQDGALGPAVTGSSQELIEARVIRAEYPPGYTPKRDSRAMIPLPHLQNDIEALTAFLNSKP